MLAMNAPFVEILKRTSLAQGFINQQKTFVPTGGLEPPIFGLGDRRLIHWATRAAYIRGGETMICQKALPLQVRLVVSCQHLSRLYNLTFSKLHLA